MLRERWTSRTKSRSSWIAVCLVLTTAFAMSLAACASERADRARERQSGPSQALLACDHDKCTPGTPLDPSCGACEAAICAEDPFCCDTEWDEFCIDQVETVCGSNECVVACPHDKCTTGDPLDPSCGSCEAAICAEDPFCCETEWDVICVEQVQTVCGSNECGLDLCPHDVCTEGAALDPSCGSCEAAICGEDPFCCDSAWDFLCVDQVATVCGQTCSAASAPTGKSGSPRRRVPR